MKVMKFGGSSVATATRMSGVLEIVGNAAETDRIILVSSAIGGCTDMLIGAGILASRGSESWKGAIEEIRSRHLAIVEQLFEGRDLDKIKVSLEDGISALCEDLQKISDKKSISGLESEKIQSYGEIFSTRILAGKLLYEGYDALWLDSRDIVVKGDEPATFRNVVSSIESFPRVRIFVAPGFIAKDSSGNIRTLGRGGSDYSAALYSAALRVPVEIWTDVPGVMTADPDLVPEARSIREMSYSTAFCMASHGAKVLYDPMIGPAERADIPIYVKNTFDPSDKGTKIHNGTSSKKWGWVGLSYVKAGGCCRMCLTADRPVNGKDDFEKIRSILKEAGMESDKYESGPCHITFSIKESHKTEAFRAIHKALFEDYR